MNHFMKAIYVYMKVPALHRYNSVGLAGIVSIVSRCIL